VQGACLLAAQEERVGQDDARHGVGGMGELVATGDVARGEDSVVGGAEPFALLGLPHVVWWTPLVVYLYRRRSLLKRPPSFAGWIKTLVVTNTVSLVVDYIDVLRYVLGDRT
jgi:hypothetical protein